MKLCFAPIPGAEHFIFEEGGAVAWRKVDMEHNPRNGQFAYFRAMENPWAGVTVPVDITAFHGALNGRPFFLSFLYAVVRAAQRRVCLLPGGQRHAAL